MEIKYQPARKDDFYKVPEKRDEDSGYDLFCVTDVVIQPGQIAQINTNLRVEIPYGYEGMIESKSGLAINKGIGVLTGTIDPSYRGEIMVILFNLGKNNVNFVKGNKVAQMKIRKYENVDWIFSNKLSESKRNKGGFGSTGI